MTALTTSFVEELRWRGLLHQTTAGDELTRHLSTPGRVAYCGFDPTSDSLTIGNFIQIKLLMHWQASGHKPIVLMGGGTGLIGDPSGKDAERTLMTRDQVDANVAGQRRIMERLLDFDSKNPNAATIVNNADWLTKFGFIDVLRDVGKHFSVNTMIQKDSVKERLHNREQGISFTEFSYMILQAYDFLHLRRAMNCTVQTAGSDQYGNIVAGIDLIRREFGSDQAFGITSVLVKAASGKKIGKTERGAVWLTADRTSPYAFYQYWINVDDQDVVPFLKWFTMMNQDQVEDISRQHESAPHLRVAHKELARSMTRLIHGESALTQVETASEALFSGEVKSLDQKMLDEVFADVPHSSHPRKDLEAEGVDLVELLPQTTLASSKREARDLLAGGAVAVNGERVAAEYRLTTKDLLHGRSILLKRGKKNWHATRWE
jgi:tyrosyl-tRNA synthetase